MRRSMLAALTVLLSLELLWAVTVQAYDMAEIRPFARPADNQPLPIGFETSAFESCELTSFATSPTPQGMPLVLQACDSRIEVSSFYPGDLYPSRRLASFNVPSGDLVTFAGTAIVLPIAAHGEIQYYDAENDYTYWRYRGTLTKPHRWGKPQLLFGNKIAASNGTIATYSCDFESGQCRLFVFARNSTAHPFSLVADLPVPGGATLPSLSALGEVVAITSAVVEPGAPFGSVYVARPSIPDQQFSPWIIFRVPVAPGCGVAGSPGSPASMVSQVSLGHSALPQALTMVLGLEHATRACVYEVDTPHGAHEWNNSRVQAITTLMAPAVNGVAVYPNALIFASAKDTHGVPQMQTYRRYPEGYVGTLRSGNASEVSPWKEVDALQPLGTKDTLMLSGYANGMIGVARFGASQNTLWLVDDPVTYAGYSIPGQIDVAVGGTNTVILAEAEDNKLSLYLNAVGGKAPSRWQILNSSHPRVKCGEDSILEPAVVASEEVVVGCYCTSGENQGTVVTWCDVMKINSSAPADGGWQLYHSFSPDKGVNTSFAQFSNLQVSGHVVGVLNSHHDVVIVDTKTGQVTYEPCGDSRCRLALDLASPWMIAVAAPDSQCSPEEVRIRGTDLTIHSSVTLGCAPLAGNMWMIDDRLVIPITTTTQAGVKVWQHWVFTWTHWLTPEAIPVVSGSTYSKASFSALTDRFFFAPASTGIYMLITLVSVSDWAAAWTPMSLLSVPGAAADDIVKVSASGGVFAFIANGFVYRVDMNHEFSVPLQEEDSASLERRLVGSGCLAKRSTAPITYPVILTAGEVWEYHGTLPYAIQGRVCGIMSTQPNSLATISLGVPGFIAVEDGSHLSLLDVRVAGQHPALGQAVEYISHIVVASLGMDTHLLLLRCELQNGFAGRGGAVTVTGYQASVIVAHCHFANNSAQSGGAVYAIGGAALRVAFTIFEGNTAQLTGGAIAITTSDLYLLGGVEFTGNTAQVSGGAVHTGYGSLIKTSTTGLTTFARNGAGVSGGAISVHFTAKSHIVGAIFEGNAAGKSGAVDVQQGLPDYPTIIDACTFTSNCALSTGGAVGVLAAGLALVNSVMQNNFVVSSQHARCADTMTSLGIVIDNSPLVGAGGALYANQAQMVDVIDCSFKNNTVTGKGGAIATAETQQFSLRDTTLWGNSATGVGGGLLCEGLGKSFDAKVSFNGVVVARNKAQSGAGIGIIACNAEVGSTQFTGNTATGVGSNGAGGGVLISWEMAPTAQQCLHGAPIVLGYELTYTNNSAAVGGAIAVVGETGNTTCRSSALACATVTTGLEDCRYAVAVLSPPAAFTQNSATCNSRGDVVYWANVPPVGPVMNDSTMMAAGRITGQPAQLVSNISGLVQVTHAGLLPPVEVSAVDVYGYPACMPPNQAVELFSHSSNASLGGRMKVVGSYAAQNVLFTQLTVSAVPSSWVYVEGSAPQTGIADLKMTLHVPTCRPGSNPAQGNARGCEKCTAGYYSPDGSECRQCPAGTFSSVAGQTHCQPCARGYAATKPGSTHCDLCQNTLFAGSNGTQCYHCPTNALCTNGIITLPNGFWYNSKLPLTQHTQILPCLHQDACISNQTAHVTCAKGHEGPLCAVCESGWVPAGTKCAHCMTTWLNWLMFVLLAMTVIYVAAYSTWRALIKWRQIRVNKGSMLGIFKMLMTHLQTMSLWLNYAVPWPAAVAVVFNASDSASAPIYSGFISCSLEWGYYVKTYIIMAAPFVAAVLLLVFPLYGWVCRCCGRSGGPDGRTFSVSLLVVWFLFYPKVVKAALSTLACSSDVGDVSYVRFDFRQVCNTNEHMVVQAIGLAVLVVFGLGAPCVTALMLYKNRKGLDTPEVRKYWLFLYSGHVREYYWWEAVLTLRKAALAVTAVIAQEPSTQVLLALTTLLVCWIAHSRCHPFKNKLLDSMEDLSLGANTLTMFVAMVFVVHRDPPMEVQWLLIGLIIAAHGAVVLKVSYYLIREMRKIPAMQRAGNMVLGLVMMVPRHKAPSRHRPAAATDVVNPVAGAALTNLQSSPVPRTMMTLPRSITRARSITARRGRIQRARARARSHGATPPRSQSTGSDDGASSLCEPRV